MLDTKTAVGEIIQEEQTSAEQSEIMRLKTEASQLRADFVRISSLQRQYEIELQDLRGNVRSAIDALEFAQEGLHGFETRGLLLFALAALRGQSPFIEPGSIPF